METQQNTVPILTGQTSPPLGDVVQAIALRIAKEAPTLADLTPDQLEGVARLVIGQNLVADLKKRSDLAGIDFPAEKVVFLDHASRTKSIHTRRAYSAGLVRLEAWASRQKVSVLEMTPTNADDFIYFLQSEGRASASVRQTTAAASSFYTWLGRRHSAIRNPFQGTRARPEKRAKKEVSVPTSDEVAVIVEAATDPVLRATLAVLAFRELGLEAFLASQFELADLPPTARGKNFRGNYLSRSSKP